MIRSIGTYLPPWTSGRTRVVGPDEDAVTMAVAAGRQALAAVDRGEVRAVVLVTRDLPLLEGGNGAALLAGLDLDPSIPVREEVGGSPAALAAATSASSGTLVIGADSAPPGASAVMTGDVGVSLEAAGRVTRSLPVSTRDASGNTTDYADPRLLRERGVAVSLERAGVEGKVAAVAGLVGKSVAQLCEGDAPVVPTLGASAAFFALAALGERHDGGRLLAIEQATVGVADLGSGAVAVHRDELSPTKEEAGTITPGSDIAISLAAYERAFDGKLRFEAAKCTNCGTLSVPTRFRCIECGCEEPTESESLPRTATVHSQTTIHVPVPSKRTPYTLVIVAVDDTDVRVLVQLTGDVAGSTNIGDTGTMVFRRVAIRSGVPDYGYAFLPDARTGADGEAVAS